MPKNFTTAELIAIDAACEEASSLKPILNTVQEKIHDEYQRRTH